MSWSSVRDGWGGGLEPCLPWGAYSLGWGWYPSTLYAMTWIPWPKIDKIFIIPLPLTLFSKSACLTAHTKTNYETGCIGRFSEKTQMYPRPLQHLRWSSMWYQKKISVGDICLSICLESNYWYWTMKEKNSVLM